METESAPSVSDIDIGRKQYKWTKNELIQRYSELKAEDRVSVTCPLTESITTLVNDLKKEGWKYKSKDQLLLSQLALKNKIN
jgi:hypothetical protein